MTEKRLFDSNRELIKEAFPPQLYELIIVIDNVLHDLGFKVDERQNVHVLPLKISAFGEFFFKGDRVFLIYNFGNIEFFVQISSNVEQRDDWSVIYWFDDYGYGLISSISDLWKMKAACLAKQMTEIIEK